MASEDADSDNLTGGTLFAVVASILLGFGPSMAKMAFDGGADDISLQGLRFALGALSIWPILKLTGRKISPLRAMWGRVLSMGVLTTIGASCYMASTRYIDVPLASLIFFTYPLIIGIIAWLCRTEVMDIRKAVAVVTCFAGVGMTVGFIAGTPDWFGIGVAVLGACCIAMTFVISVPALHATSSPVVLFTNCAIGAVIFAIGAILAPVVDYTPQLPQTSPGWVGLSLHTIVLNAGIGMLLAAIGRIGAVRATVVNNLEPLVSTMVAAVLFSQFLDGFQWLGGALIMSAIFILQSQRERNQPRRHRRLSWVHRLRGIGRP